mmetsp:Transcript_28000/g.46948  ORF Transcript_28000/g.46948 Transcript_28000/m.46948 type:complete len:202 (-) Transcript_28000:82-687(-)
MCALRSSLDLRRSSFCLARWPAMRSMYLTLSTAFTASSGTLTPSSVTVARAASAAAFSSAAASFLASSFSSSVLSALSAFSASVFSGGGAAARWRMTATMEAATRVTSSRGLLGCTWACARSVEGAASDPKFSSAVSKRMTSASAHGLAHGPASSSSLSSFFFLPDLPSLLPRLPSLSLPSPPIVYSSSSESSRTIFACSR